MSEKNDSKSYNELNSLIEKMIQLEKSKNKVNIYKVILLIAGCIAMLIMVVALCIIFHKNDFSFESLLSMLLAFFSIFIAIFFYFKADETSNRFYDTSYSFMKDVSVTLGKIEERFGEKLNNLNDKISHISMEKEEKKEELQNVEDERQDVINELLDRAKLDASEKADYLDRLRKKEDEADALRLQLQRLDIRYRYLLKNRENAYPSDFDKFSRKDMYFLENTHISDWPFYLKKKMIDLGFVSEAGELTPKGNILMEGIFSSKVTDASN